MLKTNAVKRISAFFLALMMILGTLPLNVFAEGLQGKEPGSVIVDSNTIKEEPAKEEKDSITKSERHIISFNPNGGSGEMKSVEVADGKNYTLPKNEFKAPEGKKFKNWLIENQEQKEGYILTVTRDLELKANWEDIKKIDATTQSNPKVKEDAPKEEDKLEVSENLTSDAVGVANGEWFELANEPGKTHKVRLVDYEQVNDRGDIRVTVEGVTNAIGEYELRLSTLIKVPKDSNAYSEAIDKQLSFDKSKEKLEEDLYNVTMTNLTETRNETAYLLTTTKADIIDKTVDKPIGYIKNGNIVINKLPENLKSTKYRVSTVLRSVQFNATTGKGSKGAVEHDLLVLKSKVGASQKSYEKIGKVNVEETFEYKPFKKGSNIIIRSGNTVEGKESVDVISKYEDIVSNRSGNMQKLTPVNIGGTDRFEVVCQENGLSTKLYDVNMPKSYISKGKKLHYSIEIINPENFNITSNVNGKDNLVYDKLMSYDDATKLVKKTSPNQIQYCHLHNLSAYNPSYQNINPSVSVYNGKTGFESTKSDLIIENVRLNKGNISYDYYTEGNDKRSLLYNRDVLYFYNKDKSFKLNDYLEKPIYLKNLSLINSDGSYDIPMYKIKVTRGNEVIAELTTRIQGKLNVPSGSSFSNLYKITHENREEVVEIPVEEQRVPDNTMLKGEEKVIQQGVAGSKKVVYDVQFVDGKEYSKVEKSAKVIKEMKPKIIHYGTAEKLVNKTKETVKYDTIYEADQTLKYEEKKTTQQGKDGAKDVTTTITLVSGKRQESKNEVVTVKPTSEIIKVGNKKVDTEKIPFKVTEQIDKTLKEGQTKIKVKGVEGLKTTTTIYEVDKKTGKLINPKETVTKKDPVDQIVLKGTKPDSIKTSIEAKVKYFGVGGAEEKPEAGKYKFVLKDNQGKVVSEATNDKNGNIVFKELNITDKEIGSHKYTVEQVKGDDLTIEYDTHIEDVTVNVSLSDDNKLSAKVTYDKDGAVFGNRLNTTSIQFVRLAEGEKPFVAEEVKNNKGLVVSHKISDKDKAKTIDGAEYDIYKINSDGTETKVTSIKTENGISNLVENLVPGKYKLKETKSPEGYFTTSKDIEFEITKEDAGKALVKFVSGEDNGAGGKIMEMPSTGGQGTKALMIGGGALLIVMAGVFVLANKKKKELNK